MAQSFLVSSVFVLQSVVGFRKQSEWISFFSFSISFCMSIYGIYGLFFSLVFRHIEVHLDDNIEAWHHAKQLPFFIGHGTGKPIQLKIKINI